MDVTALRKIIKDAQNIVFFGGAGVSTESDIPDFRSDNGLYKEKKTVIPPEVILSHDYLMHHPKEFYEYYKTKMVYPDAKPNQAHIVLAELEKRGKLKAVITQNIDGLHQMAGSKNVIELHGSILKNYCVSCGCTYTLSDVMAADGVPHCKKCGGFVRPDVVMYGECLDMDAIDAAEEAIATADVLIVGGTSLTVNPAASLVTYYRGKHFIIINRDPTPFDRYAECVIHDSIGKVLTEITKE